jgi:glutamate N-acetyltransferase/amino-acid N-acetyltransferase
MSAVSPLAPVSFPELPPIAGVELASHAAGLRYTGRDDVLIARLAPDTTVAGVFTKSLCTSAPVDWCKRILPNGTARALVVNSGNANAFTGAAGESATALTADLVATALGIGADQVHLASTGVIGEVLSEDVLRAQLPEAAKKLTPSSPTTWTSAADAIRTTDTFAKGTVASTALGQTIVGIAKGSGMIAPDMATMLGFVFTDASIDPELLQEMLATSTTRTFNRITVDSDTSTSDTVLLFATGQSAAEPITAGTTAAAEFQEALDAVNLDLAQQIVRDGEGATKFVEVAVRGAESDAAASTIALAIANSPLVKTALAAEDANWGRIVMAVGKAGERADRDSLRIWIGDVLVAENGKQAPEYSEELATNHLRNDNVHITVDVGVGTAAATVWTCDLTHGYIEINAGYRS